MSARQGPGRVIAALAASVSLSTLAYVTYVHPAAAQQAAQPADQPTAAGQGALEEIVVTARRKEEKAQTVPILVTTQTGQMLDEEHFVDVKDIGMYMAAGLMSGNNAAYASQISIRGVLSPAPYFDEMPIIFPPYPGYATGFDLANAQVLKGPQGTLFGQSADPGAILFTTNPTRNDFGGNVEAEAGDYGHRHLEGVLNVPLVDDKLVVRVGAQYQHLDGYEKDLVTGVKLGAQDYDIYRVTITARPTDDFQNDFVAQYFWSDGTTQFAIPWYINQVQTTTVLGFTTNTSYHSYGPLFLAQNQVQTNLGRYAFVAGTYRPGGEFQTDADYFLVDTARWDINDDMALKNILGYDEVAAGPSQGANSPVPVALYPLSAATQAQLNAHPLVAPPGIVQYSEELQLQGKALNDKLGYTVGSYNSIGGTRQPSQGPVYNASSSLTGGAVSGSMVWGSRRSYGVYSQGTYDLGDVADGLSVTLGGRYTWDIQYEDSTAWTGTGALSAHGSAKAYSHSFSYLASLDYQIDPATLVYANVAKGFGKGGFTGGNAIYTFPAFTVYGPETLTNFALGIKSDWQILGVKTRANLEAFYGLYDNVQVVENFNIASPVAGVPPAQLTATANAPKAHIEGIDGDLTFVLTEDLTFGLSWDYNQVKFDNFINNGVDWKDAWQFEDPHVQINGNLTYKLPFLEWIASGQDLGNLVWTGRYYRQSHYSGVTFLNQINLSMTQGYDNIDMSLKWNNVMGVNQLDMLVYVKNLDENHFQATLGTGYLTTGTTALAVAVPRTWGVTIRKSF